MSELYSGEREGNPEAGEAVVAEIEQLMVELQFCETGELQIPLAEDFVGLDAEQQDQLRNAYYDRLEERIGVTPSNVTMNACAVLGRAALQWRRGMHDLADENMADAIDMFKNVPEGEPHVERLRALRVEMRSLRANG